MVRELQQLMPTLTSERPCCDGCGASAPDTNTDYTLISKSFGWRLTRRKLPDGALTMEWRCASCWKKYKGERAVPPSVVATVGSPAAARSSHPPREVVPSSSRPPRPVVKLFGVR
jgi:hypothetical protein